MGRGEAWQDRGKIPHAEIVGCAESDPSFKLGNPKAGHGFGIDAQDVLGMHEKCLAVRGQRHMARMPDKQGARQLILNPPSRSLWIGAALRALMARLRGKF